MQLRNEQIIMESMAKKSFIKNVSFAFIANIISLVTSITIVFILPKFIGVTQYSYYQLYIFYASYIGFCGIGWVDGIQLRYAGKYYDKLNKPLIFSELKIFCIIEILCSISIILITYFLHPEINKAFVYVAVALCVVIYNPRAFLHNLLQITGHIKEYTFNIIIEKSIHITITLLGIILGKGNFVWFVISELLGRFCGAIYIYIICQDMYVREKIPKSILLKDIKLNITSGLILTFSNIASMLIIGIIRQFIITFWSVETFGKISLTLSVSGFILVFINSIAIVFFPFLKRCPKENFKYIYRKARTTITVILLGFLILYLPIKIVMSYWLPQYIDSLKYMAILLPMCLYESKASLLTTTYMKALRMEKTMLYINIAFVTLSFIAAFLISKIFHQLNYMILLILAIVMFRYIVSEIILKKQIKIDIYKDMLLEILLTFVFIFTAWIFSDIKGLIIYLITYLVYLSFKYKDLMLINKQI